MSSRAVYGPLSFYVRGEFQHAPDGPARPFAAQQRIALADGIAFLPPSGIAAVNGTRFVEAYGSIQLGGWQLAFGKQSLWWSPDRFGAFMFSNNAEAPLLARLSRTSPLALP